MNENLTPVRRMPYSGRSMEPQKVESPDDEKRKEREIATAAFLERQKKAREEWNRLNEDRKQRGQDIPEEGKRLQEGLILKGVSPKSILEFFETNPATAVEFNQTIGQIEDHILAGGISVEEVKNNEDALREWVKKGIFTKEQAEAAQRRLEATAAEAEKKQARMRAFVEEQIKLAKKAYEKKKKGEELTETEERALREAISEGAISGVEVEELTRISKEITKEEVLENASLSDEKRLEKAAEVLGRNLLDKEQAAILAAHNVGAGEEGRGEGPAEVFNYTQKQIAEKARILKIEGEFNKEERRALLESGIAGLPPESFNAIVPGTYTDSDVQSIASLVRDTGGDGNIDSAFLQNTLLRLDSKINSGAGNVAEARALRDQLQVLTRAATALEVQEAAGRGRETGRSARAREQVEEVPLTDDDYEKLAQLYEITNSISHEEALEKARKEGVPRGEKIGDPTALVEDAVKRTKDFDEFKRSISPNGFIRERADELIRISSDWRNEAERVERTLRYQGRMDKIVQEAKDLAEAIDKFNEEIKRPLFDEFDRFRKESRGLRSYDSIQEIANDIMIQTAGDFARDGKYALLKSENGKEVFQEANFLRWLRDRMYEFHDSDVDNPVNMWERISVIGGARATSITEMIFTKAMFTDENRGYLETLRDQVFYELWLFNTARDTDAIYRQILGDDEKLPEKLYEIYMRNAFTKRDTMDKILTLPNLDLAKQGELKWDSGDTLRESNQDTGKALRRALLAYYYIIDPEMLKKIEGGDENSSILFSNKNAVAAYIKAKLGERKPGEKEEEFQKREREKIFDAIKKFRYTEKYLSPDKRGLTAEYLEKLKADSKEYELKYEDTINDINADIARFEQGKLRANEEPDFMEAINPYNRAKKDLDLKDETKERIRLFTMQQANISYEEARYAETFAFAMTRWSGAGAKNDTGAVGFDAWTKVLLTEEYRERQALSRRGGVHGNIYSFAGFKRLGVDFFIGTADKRGKSILEIIQGGQGDEVDLKSKLEKVTFGENTMAQFADNHINRTFKLFHNIVDTHEFNFDKFVTIDQFGRMVFDPEKANAFMDEHIKAFRYAYSTWDGLDYSKFVRFRGKDGNFKEMTVGQALWGYQVYADYVNKGRKVKGFENATIGEVIQNGKSPEGTQLRNEIFKRPLMYAIAGELTAHRKFDSGYRKYKSTEVEKIYQFLETFAGDVKSDEYNLQNTKRIKRFFTPEDIQWIRKASDTGVWRIWLGEFGGEGSIGLLEGLVKAAGQFLGSLDKVT